MATVVRFGKAQSFGRREAPRQAAAAASVLATTAAITQPAPVARGVFYVPVLTLLLMAVLTVVFWAQLRFSYSPDLSVNDHFFVALGGLSWRFLALRGEWWRFFTAAFLHADLNHILGNGIVLVAVGWRLERMIGRAWLAAAFFVSAWGGSIGSLSLAPSGIVTSLGASGAIMGLVALLFTLSFHTAAEGRERFHRRLALFLLIPALLPSMADGGQSIDIGAHFGGAIAGTGLGFLLLILWPEDGLQPPLSAAAASVAVIGLAAAACAFVVTAQHYPAYARDAAKLAPRWELLTAEKENRASELVAAFPHDPLAHLLRAGHALELRDQDLMLSEIRAGLAEKWALDTYYPPTVEIRLRLFLVLILINQERMEDAHNEAAPICYYIGDRSKWPEQQSEVRMLTFLHDDHVCE